MRGCTTAVVTGPRGLSMAVRLGLTCGLAVAVMAPTAWAGKTRNSVRPFPGHDLRSTLWTVAVPKFSDQTVSAGLCRTHQTVPLSQQSEPHQMTGGAAVGDFNRDGYQDLFVPGGMGQNAALYINNGDGTFVDRATEWGIDLTISEGAASAAVDVDNDGDIDIYSGTLWGRNFLLLNDGQGGFVDAGARNGASMVNGRNPISTFGASFGDVDGDGDLDLVTAEWSLQQPAPGNACLENNGFGNFSDIGEAVNVFTDPGPVFGFSPAIVDMNGDQAPDIAFVADFGTSRYYANNGGGVFTWLTGNGTGSDENGMGSALADYDNDGDLDWFITSIYDGDGINEAGWGMTGNRLFRNDGNHQFTDVTDIAGVRNGDWGWGTSFGDLNNDGLLDLAMTNGYVFGADYNPDPTFVIDPTRVWVNTGRFDGKGGPTFVNVTHASGVHETDAGKGLVMFDAENDGDLDMLIIVNRGPMRYFRNDSNPSPNTWIEIDLTPPAGNAPDGIGSVIDVTIDNTTYSRSVYAVPSFMSQNPLRSHFGFPYAKSIDEIRVTWQDGTSTTLTNVAPGQVLEITP